MSLTGKLCSQYRRDLGDISVIGHGVTYRFQISVLISLPRISTISTEILPILCIFHIGYLAENIG
ncbi:hypothetical protein HanIR_Chr08g0380951 [Helianthus annuus]|nr:hypothetical protein HanIR_Chr08g0380951 [Helianthus annuus]